MTNKEIEGEELIIRGTEFIRPNLEFRIGEGYGVLFENEDGQLDFKGGNVTEAAELFFNEVVKHHCNKIVALEDALSRHLNIKEDTCVWDTWTLEWGGSRFVARCSNISRYGDGTHFKMCPDCTRKIEFEFKGLSQVVEN